MSANSLEGFAPKENGSVELNSQSELEASAIEGPKPKYIVGIGASAGGLEALERLFSSMPDKSDMAFVVIQHLSPDFRSVMDELLARWTKLPITNCEDGTVVLPNQIYLMPPKKLMIISGGKLWLKEKVRTEELSLPIDQFLRSLAQDAGTKSIGIILSGTGSDGSRGIRAIHEAGGYVLVQDVASAKFDGMPRNAVETGCTDEIVTPEMMPSLLMRYSQEPKLTEANEGVSGEYNSMPEIVAILKKTYNLDFSNYKPTTIARRIQRRIDPGQSHNKAL